MTIWTSILDRSAHKDSRKNILYFYDFYTTFQEVLKLESILEYLKERIEFGKSQTRPVGQNQPASRPRTGRATSWRLGRFLPQRVSDALAVAVTRPARRYRRRGAEPMTP
jgi:hypothetical protein